MAPRLTLAALLLALSTSRPVDADVMAVQAASASDWKAGISNLASLDYPIRMNAARLVRRAPAAEAAVALIEAVRRHSDEFVRYRAFVLLTAFNDRATPAVVVDLLRDRNDRLREAAYKWLELHPDARLTETLLGSLQTEQAEFVRPALIAALAALDENAQVQRALVGESMRGLDFFRSAVIDALGRHRASYAVETLANIAKLDGPLQIDAILALGRIGGERGRAGLADLATAPAGVLPALRAARCLSGDRCEPHIQALSDAIAGPGPASNARAAAVALTAIASDGNTAAIAALVGLGGRSGARDHAAIGLGTAALRRADAVLLWIDASADPARSAAIDLLKEGFERLEEDFAEEQFYATTRAAYWKAAEGSATRDLAATLIQRLDF